MSKVRNYLWLSTACILMMFVVFLHTDIVQAAEYDGSSKGSIHVELNDLGTKKGGVSFTCYQAASASSQESNLTFVPTEAFQGAGVDFNGIITANANREASGKLLGFVQKNNPKGKTGITNDDGRVDFTNLEQGVYLIVQDKKGDYGTVAPFLAAIPYCEEGQEWIYDVKVQAKGELIPTDPPKTDPPKTDTPKTPTNVRTEDDTEVLLYVVLLLAAAAVLVTGRKRVVFK